MKNSPGHAKTSVKLRALATLAILGAGLSGCDFSDTPSHDDELSVGMTQAFEELNELYSVGWTCSGVVPPDSDAFDGRIALTFDDGPRPGRTEQVMDIVEAHGARATFFINGSRVVSEREEALLAEMVRRGHTVANHTQNHRNARTLSAAEFRTEVELTDAIIADATGLRPAFFRYPYGAASCDTNEYLRSLGYAWVGWHIDSADWCFANSTGGVGYCAPSTFAYVDDALRDDMGGFVLAQARRRDGGILLFHDIHQFTVDELEDILSRLEADGFRFVSLSDEAAFPILNGATPEAPAWIGDACDNNADCDYAGGECVRFTSGGETVGVCSASCDGYCPDRAGRPQTFCVDNLDGSGGMCTAKPASGNGYCSDVPGTESRFVERYIDSSSASPSMSDACMPTPDGEAPPPPRWIGDACAGDADCTFAGGYCAGPSGLDGGFCSLRCAGYCPDRAGHATTFCVAALDGAGGTCAAKAEASNGYCAEVAATERFTAARFIGSSGARAASAEVCLPTGDPEPPATPRWIGDACTQDGECRFTGGFCARFADAGFCSQRCDGYCPDRAGHATTFCVAANDGGGGMCASKSVSANSFCADVAGTSTRAAPRYRLTSGAPAATANVCLP